MQHLSPSSVAEGVLGLMIEREDTQRKILEETLDSQDGGQILESGRTLCNANKRIKGPISRFPRAVDLQECPLSGSGGAWHTHVTPSELLNPRNSLPDMAAVVFGGLDVIGVVGTESAEYFMSAGDQQKMEQEFRDAIGAEIHSQEELLAAVEDGRLNPSTARSRVRKRLDPLITRDETGFPDLSSRARGEGVIASALDGPYEMVEVSMIGNFIAAEHGCYHETMADPKGCNVVASQMGDQVEKKLQNKVPGAVKSTALGAAVGTVVGGVVEKFLPF